MSEKSKKTSWFKGVRKEFKKIIWTSKEALVKQTIAVISVTVVLGAIIALIDFVSRYGVDLLVK